MLVFVVNTQARDVEEGADMIMVKPGMAYLDIVRDLKNQVQKTHNNPYIHTTLCLHMASLNRFLVGLELLLFRHETVQIGHWLRFRLYFHINYHIEFCDSFDLCEPA